MSRKKSRDYAFKLIFEKFFHEPELDLEPDEDEEVLSSEDREFASFLIKGVNEHYDEIMDIIEDNTVGYKVERIFKVDLAILVLAVYELKFDGSSPKEAIINEAVSLAKKYSTEKSFSFINGVLAKVVE